MTIEPEPLQQVNRTYVRFHTRKLSYFSGCDYFRLASHPKVRAAARTALDKFGLSVAASRFTTGNHKLYAELENALASFFGAQAALLVSSGYQANLVAAQALAGTFSHCLLDDQAHASLTDAALQLDCPVLRFRHRDPEAAVAAARRCGTGAKLILLTDGMFARDGSAAPLKTYLELLPQDAVMLVDDAHGAGVLGPTGKGTLEHEGVSRRRVIQTITLSKALGTFGGAILGSARLRRRMLDRSQMIVASTPLPLPLAAGALAALKVLKNDPSLRRRLETNIAFMRTETRRARLNIPATPGPIIRLTVRASRDAARLHGLLLRAGIFPPAGGYPGEPTGFQFRFVISSEHTKAQLRCLGRVLRSWTEAT